MLPSYFYRSMDYIFIPTLRREPTCSLYGVPTLRRDFPRYSLSFKNRGPPIQLDFSIALRRKVATDAECVYDLAPLTSFSLVALTGRFRSHQLASLDGRIAIVEGTSRSHVVCGFPALRESDNSSAFLTNDIIGGNYRFCPSPDRGQGTMTQLTSCGIHTSLSYHKISPGYHKIFSEHPDRGFFS